MERKIFDIIEEIDSIGGIVKATERGWLHNEISSAAADHQAAVESGERPVVGVNCFQIEDEEPPFELFETPETFEVQSEKLRKIKKERSTSEVQKALDSISRCCEENENLMEVIMDVVKVPVTEGEITKTLKRFYGIWGPPLF
jgi:methylmalonyl-CoA mutase N-terminal domain/subunit